MPTDSTAYGLARMLRRVDGNGKTRRRRTQRAATGIYGSANALFTTRRNEAFARFDDGSVIYVSPTEVRVPTGTIRTTILKEMESRTGAQPMPGGRGPRTYDRLMEICREYTRLRAETPVNTNGTGRTRRRNHARTAGRPGTGAKRPAD